MASRQLMLPASRAFNSNGVPIAGAVAKLYTTGTTTPANFYSDTGLTVSLGSSITANAAGRFDPLPYQNETTPFRFRLETPAGVEIEDIDPFYFGQTYVTLPVPELSPGSYGAAGDGTTDDNGAFQSLAVEDQGHAFVVPAEKYRISASSVYRGHVSIHGYGAGYNPGTVDGVSYPYPTFFNGSVIYSDANITALEFQPFTSETDVATVIADLAAHRTQQSAHGSKMADLAIVSAGNGAAHANKHGIYSRTRIMLNNVLVWGHGDDGVKVEASQLVDGHAYGNANTFQMWGVESGNNAGDGFYIGGRDVNASLMMGLNANNNDGWGIQDQSLIGTTYIAPHVATNALGSIKTAEGCVTIVGGYIETGVGALTDLGSNTMVIGGNAANEVFHDADSPAFVLNGGTAHCKGISGKNRTGTMNVMAGLGRDPSGTAATVLWFGSDDDTASMDAFRLTKDFHGVGLWTLNYGFSAAAEILQFVTSDHAGSALANGWALGLPSGLYMGTAESAPRLCPAAAAMPATGSYRAGDLVPNNTPAVGGILLWRRLTTGSAHVAGTDWELVYALTGAVSDTAYDATTWNSSLGVPTKNAVRDKIEAMKGAAVADLTSVATVGSLPTPNGSITIADAATPTVAELLEYCVELEAKFEALTASMRAASTLAT